MRPILRTIFLFLTFGFVSALLIIQNNANFKKKTLEFIIENIEKELKIKAAVKSCSINLFTGSITMYECVMQDMELKTCKGQCKKAVLSIGKLGYLLFKRVYLYLDLYDAVVNTRMPELNIETSDAYNIIMRLSNLPVSAPITMQTVTVHNYAMRFIDRQNLLAKINGILHVNFDHKLNGWRFKINANYGSILCKNLIFCNKIQGNVTGYQDFTHLDAQKNPFTCFFGNVHYFINDLSTTDNVETSIHYEYDKKEFTLLCKPRQLDSLITLNQNNYNISGTFPLELAQKTYAKYVQKTPDVTGICNINLTIWPEKTKSKGTLNLKNITVEGIDQGNAECNIKQKNNVLKTKFFWHHPYGDFFGTAYGNNLKQEFVTFTLTNMKQCKPFLQKSLVIAPNKGIISGSINQQGIIKATYQLKVIDSLTKKAAHFSGQIKFEHPIITIHGTAPEGHMSLTASVTPQLHLLNCMHEHQGKKNILLRAHTTNPFKLIGKVRYDFVYTLMPFDLKRTLHGKQGVLTINLDQHDYNNISGQIKLKEGKLFLAGSYNLIKALSFHFNLKFPQKKLCITNFDLTCFRGNVTSPQMLYIWSDEPDEEFIHAPICFNDLLLNWKKDFYSFICGKALYEKRPGKHPEFTSDVILQRSLLRENIFSSVAQDALLASTFVPCVSGNDLLKVALNIMSEEPVAAKTPFMQTSASLDLSVKSLYSNGVMQTPEMTGSINLDGGFLQFLRHKLMITQGKINFIPHHMTDPVIDLIAKNRIKKYIITLTASGSLSKPHILLESVPELHEEQILALLLAGSENASLQADLPAILMQNLNTLLLGTQDKASATNIFFRKISKPLQYVQITPHFADQAGKGGGIKGTVAIDITPQLHAQIQKDFSFQEDLSFQIEYFLTDDLNIKAIRESSGDVKAEAEVRLKF